MFLLIVLLIMAAFFATFCYFSQSISFLEERVDYLHDKFRNHTDFKGSIMERRVRNMWNTYFFALSAEDQAFFIKIGLMDDDNENEV